MTSTLLGVPVRLDPTLPPNTARMVDRDGNVLATWSASGWTAIPAPAAVAAFVFDPVRHAQMVERFARSRS